MTYYVLFFIHLESRRVYLDGRPEARVTGTPQRPIVAVAAGLIRRYPGDSNLVRVYLLHEIRAPRQPGCVALLLGGRVEYRLPGFDNLDGALQYSLLIPVHDPGHQALLLMVGILWLGTLALTSLYLLRFAGVLISFRELQVDIWAVSRFAGLRTLRESRFRRIPVFSSSEGLAFFIAVRSPPSSSLRSRAARSVAATPAAPRPPLALLSPYCRAPRTAPNRIRLGRR